MTYLSLHFSVQSFLCNKANVEDTKYIHVQLPTIELSVWRKTAEVQRLHKVLYSHYLKNGVYLDRFTSGLPAAFFSTCVLSITL